MSPTLSKLSNAFENFSVETLVEVIGQLVCDGNLKHFNVSIANNVVPEEVPLDQEVLGPVGDLLVGSKQLSAIVVLKNAATIGGLEVWWQSQFLADFPKKVTKWQ